MALEPAIVEYIQTRDTDNLSTIASQVQAQFGVRLGLQQVKRALQSDTTRERIVDAKERASGGLGDRVDRIQEVEDELYKMFNDGITVNDKLLIAKELRQWIKQGIDVSGIHDDETNTLFIIGENWSTNSDDF